MLSIFRFIVPVVFAIVCSSCSGPDSRDEVSDQSGPPVVQVANYPLAYFAERVAGDLVTVEFLAPSDGDPAFWKPTPEQIGAMQKADLLLLNGAGYSKWLATTSLPQSIQVDTSSAFSGDFIETEGAASHKHGEGDAHSHGGIAFTTWMDFQQAIWQAEEVRDALIGLLPEQEAAISKNFEALADDLDALHQEFKALGAALGDKPLVVSHPIYQYFGRRYGLAIESVLWEPEIVPDTAAMADLQKILAEHPAKWMLWEGEPAMESVKKLEAIGVKSVVIDPCGNRPESGDWLAVMRQNVENLKAVTN